MRQIIILAATALLLSGFTLKPGTESAYGVIARICGEKNAARFDLAIDKTMQGNDAYAVTLKGGRIIVRGNSPVALCRGAYDYLSNACQCRDSVFKLTADFLHLLIFLNSEAARTGCGRIALI